MTVLAHSPMVREVLPNGLRVCAVRRDWSPAVAVNVSYSVGSWHDPVGRSGFAHLFEHLMFQGSRQVASGEHMSLVVQAGGVFNGSTSFDRTNYFETLPVQGLDLALWLEADRLGTLPDALNQANLDNQREVVKNERRQRYDDVPYGTAIEQLFAAAFPAGHGCHHTTIGTHRDLDAASLQDVHGFFHAHYRPSRAVLTVAGDIPPELSIERVAHFFGAVPEPPTADQLAPDEVALPEPTVLTQTSRVPAPAVHLLFRLPPDGTAGLDAGALAVRMLAGGPRSRLHERLVRRDGIALAASGTLTRLRWGNSVAAVSIRGLPGTDPGKLWDAAAHELDRLAVYGPTAAEFTGARAMEAHAERKRLDSLPGLADELSRRELATGDAAMALQAPDRWSRLSLAETAQAAALLAAPRAFRLVTLPSAA